MQDLPPRTAAGRNPEDDVACGRPQVAVDWLSRSLHSLVQDGKPHGNNSLQLKTHGLPQSPRTPGDSLTAAQVVTVGLKYAGDVWEYGDHGNFRNHYKVRELGKDHGREKERGRKPR
jgi:hypothetical protein